MGLLSYSLNTTVFLYLFYCFYCTVKHIYVSWFLSNFPFFSYDAFYRFSLGTSLGTFSFKIFLVPLILSSILYNISYIILREKIKDLTKTQKRNMVILNINLKLIFFDFWFRFILHLFFSFSNFIKGSIFFMFYLFYIKKYLLNYLKNLYIKTIKALENSKDENQYLLQVNWIKCELNSVNAYYYHSYLSIIIFINCFCFIRLIFDYPINESDFYFLYMKSSWYSKVFTMSMVYMSMDINPRFFNPMILAFYY